MSWSASSSPVDPAETFAKFILALCEIVAVEGSNRRFGQLTVRIWSRITQLGTRFGRLIATPRRTAPRPPRSSPPAPRSKPEPRPPGAPRPKPKWPNPLPGGYAWLTRVIPETRLLKSQLSDLLADPEMAAFIKTTPSAGRILRPLLHMLGIKPPEPLQLPPRPPRPAPDPDKPRRIPVPRVHPICDYQPGPRKDELRAYRDADFMAPRTIRI